MNYPIFSILLVVLACSCKKDKEENILKLKADYSSAQNIQSIRVYTNTGLTTHHYTDSISLKIRNDVNITDTSWHIKNMPNSDGNFVVKATLNNTEIVKEFGYFTNGNLTNKHYDINISDASITISQ